jgi:hypothetical protein
MSNYYENINITGVSNNSSMADYWARISEGINYTDLKGGAGIAYDAWVMDTITGTGGSLYGTIFSHYGDSTFSQYGQTISRVITNQGYKGEHAFSMGANISNKFFLGITFGINTINYMGHYDHLENDYAGSVYDFKSFTYTDHFEATGIGYAFKIGAIYRPIELIRIGFAFHAPFGYRMHEYFYDNIASSFDNVDKYTSANDPLRYDYTLTTPMRILGGVSFQIKKLAILSADYEYVDYGAAKFSRASGGYDYYNENQSIKTILSKANNWRFGAEFRFGSIYFRGGYALYGSAFAKGEVNEKMNYNNISGGIGYRQNNYYFDIGYSNLFYTQKYFMYDDPPYLQPASIKMSKNTFAATFGMKF